MMHDFTRDCFAAVVNESDVHVDPDRLDALAIQLRRYFGGPELVDVVLDIVRLAFALRDELGDAAASDALMSLAATAAPALHKLGHDAARLATSLERGRDHALRAALGRVEIAKFKAGRVAPAKSQVRAGPTAMFELLAKT